MKSPVALFIFNRPDCAERVFQAIADAKPEKLFLIADGPRPNREGENEKCAATRAAVQRIDWDCEILTDFAEVNLGCTRRLTSGLDWVFEQSDRAIILEDDCLPDPTFFPFCDELLERYADDERVMMIGGVNFLSEWKTPGQSYSFSYFGGTWGWASWRRAWRLNDPEMKLWPMVLETRALENMFPNPRHMAYWKSVFQNLYDEAVKGTWDYQWLLSCWMNSGYRLFPEVNLISNIGYREDATHTFGDSPFANMPTKPIAFPLQHPSMMIRSVEADALIQELFSPPEAAAAQPAGLGAGIAGRIRRLASKARAPKTRVD
jgi:hypothetical protein